MTEQGYHLLDSGNYKKLEKLGPYSIVRPSLQAAWPPVLDKKCWDMADATFSRSPQNTGSWIMPGKILPQSWHIDLANLQFIIRMTDFGHLGIFPEQVSNWILLKEILNKASSRKRPVRILNLFAYTGGATLICADSGAEVVHCDASKTTVAWARENTALCGLSSRPIHWITEDVKKYVRREVRRGSKYDGLILDPPTFGRGTRGEVWKIEDDLMPLLEDLKQLLSEECLFVLLSSHSPGFTPLILKNMLHSMLSGMAGLYRPEEMVITEDASKLCLPSGSSCWFVFKN